MITLLLCTTWHCIFLYYLACKPLYNERIFSCRQVHTVQGALAPVAPAAGYSSATKNIQPLLNPAATHASA